MTFKQPQKLKTISDLIGAKMIGDENFQVLGTNEIHRVNKELESKIIAETYVNGVINGIYLSRSELKNATIKQQNVMPSNTPETKSSVQKILSNPWVLLVSGIAIEEVTLGRIYKYIFQLL